jgi:hypothetical protein
MIVLIYTIFWFSFVRLEAPKKNGGRLAFAAFFGSYAVMTSGAANHG